ncbi:MAG: TetR/AcrR family transcriptional regulator [Nitrospirae bacterium]|nr:TetR/AcrR family transcriptional regulator [Nitrospirota bacterium]
MLKKNRREDILKAAIGIFSQKGYHDTRISDIIKPANIARGTFYLYFDHKRQIFDSILNTLLVELDQCIKNIEVGKDRPHPLNQLRGNLTRVFTLLIENPDLGRILLRHATGLDDRVAYTIEDALKLGIKMGLIRECNPKISSYCILGGIKEVIEHFSLTKKGTAEIDAIVEEVLNFGIHGLKNPALPSYFTQKNK